MSSEDVTQNSPASGQAPGAADAATTPYSAGFVPPEPASLAAHFPHLEIIEALGHGGMGAVYKARQPKLDRLVALKIIRPESADNSAYAERFNREARMLARMSHPHIVGIYDFGEVTVSDAGDGPNGPKTMYYFLMEYVEGANLRQLMRAGELSPEQALAIVPQICEALQFAHDEGVVHRDIKPENILLDKKGRVKVADFGLAKLATSSPQNVTLTQTHQVMGTPRYMAPEQLDGAHSVDHRADIYSLGVVFYEMLTGEVPAGHFQPPSKKVEVDVRLDDVVLRALAREPERRYQHASNVKTDVESIAAKLIPKKAAPKQATKVLHRTAKWIAGEFVDVFRSAGIVLYRMSKLIVIAIVTLAAILAVTIIIMSLRGTHKDKNTNTPKLANGGDALAPTNEGSLELNEPGREQSVDLSNTVSGQVMFNNDAVKARLTLATLSGPKIVPASTDESGRFTFPNVPPGKYILSAVSLKAIQNVYRRARVEITIPAAPQKSLLIKVELQ